MDAVSEQQARQTHILEITRVLDAPQRLVFRMWTTPEHLVRWWGPKNYTSTSQRMEFRPGGLYRHTIHAPNGEASVMSGVYREIVEPSKIVFTFAWNDNRSAENLVTVTFEPVGERTRMTFRQEPFADIATRDSHVTGWGECLDRLVDALA